MVNNIAYFEKNCTLTSERLRTLHLYPWKYRVSKVKCEISAWTLTLSSFLIDPKILKIKKHSSFLHKIMKVLVKVAIIYRVSSYIKNISIFLTHSLLRDNFFKYSFLMWNFKKIATSFIQTYFDIHLNNP